MPLLANCQSTAFYPSRLILLFLDVDAAMTVFVLLKLGICGMTAYLCARLMRFSVPAARFFSVAWMMGGFCLIWSNWPETDVAGWLPVLFLGVELILKGSYRRGFFAMVLGASLLLIAGHPETALVMALGTAFYFAARLILERRWGRDLWVPLGLCSAAWTLALLVYGVQLLPFIEYLVNSSTFSHRRAVKLDIPLQPGALVTFWVSRFFGTWAENTFWDKGKWNSNLCSEQYMGMAVWFGAMLLLTRSTKAQGRSERARVPALVLTVALCLLLSVRFTTLNWVHELPVFSSLLEIYHVFFVLFAIPLLGMIGLERWFSRPRKLRELAWVLPLVLGVSALVLYLLSFYGGLLRAAKVADYVNKQVMISALFAAAVVVVLAASCIWYRPKVFWGVLTAVLAMDLVFAARGLNPTLPRKYVYPETALTRFMEACGKPCRFGVAEAAIISGTICNYGIEEWLGYDGLFPERAIRFQTTLGPNVWHAMEPVYSVQYYLNDPGFEPSLPLDELKASGAVKLATVLDGLEVYKNLRAFPRARLVPEVEVIPDRDALFARMLDESFRPELRTVSQVAPSGPLPHAKGADLGGATITEYTANRVTVDVSANEDAILVLSDAYYPGWQAYLDGIRTDMFPAYYMFRGVVVPAGGHAVCFEYRPWSLRIGLAISILGLLAGLIVGLVFLFKAWTRTQADRPRRSASAG